MDFVLTSALFIAYTAIRTFQKRSLFYHTEGTMSTIIDVAKRAGVSKSTVSLVINGSKLVKDETREKVQQAIRELEYVPNNSARGLITKYTRSIGVVVLSEGDPAGDYNFQVYPQSFSTDVIKGISAELENTDYCISIEYFSAIDSGRNLPNLVKSRRVDGVLVVGSLFCDSFYQSMMESGIPFIMIGVGKLNMEVNAVVSDAISGVEEAYSYLASCGHKRIAFLNCAKEYRTFPEMNSGIEHAIEQLKLDSDKRMNMVPANHSGQAGFEAIRAIWESGSIPDAVVIANASLALGAMRYFYENRIRVPDDISVVVFGDSILCGYSAPALTAVNLQKEKMGRLAARRLRGIISGDESAKGMLLVHPELTVRDSVRNFI